MAIDMKQAQRRLIDEAFGKGNLAVFDEICDTSYRAHDPLTGDSDLNKEKENCRTYRSAFPDLKPTILAAYSDGDTAIQHWRMTGTHKGELKGIAPTGAHCTVEGVTISKFKNGKVVESWVHWDALGMMRQLGVSPGVQSTPGARQSEVHRHI
jgi:hypothetical protein